MGKIIFNQRTMQEYFSRFDVFRHKFLYALEAGVQVDPQTQEGLLRNFYTGTGGHWDMDQAVETFLTLDKVYHYGSARDTENTGIVELVTEKFLRQYVNIEGMEELFRSSYFYFEWMMHLEYKEEQHDYSYYRDHYLHQARNLYEMFELLDQGERWRTCMNIYKAGDSRAAAEMRSSVREQNEKMTPQRKKCMEEIAEEIAELTGKPAEGTFEESCYHYIIFATAAVSSLVHDIGYPVVYMRRNMDKIQGFLPMSHIFMDAGNCMPHIKSLLSNSLLFSTVKGEEIQRRLEDNDHGAYSAIILLTQYYDNGRVFSLDPIKRMVVELSALVIYNHTLKYEFQNKSRYDRCHSVFADNPISYLFRLCDDLQEWERVYFLISDKSAFFVCDQCKTPMIRRRNKRHVSDDGENSKCFSYSCMCGARGWNSLWFPNRRMINVAPFTELIFSREGKTGGGKKDKWIFELKCDRKALLQLARYNDTFAPQRLRGVRELREMLKNQEMLPDIYVRAFLTNNPAAVKVKILEEFIRASGMNKNIRGSVLALRNNVMDKMRDADGRDELSDTFFACLALKEYIRTKGYAATLYQGFCEKWEKADGESGEENKKENDEDEEKLRWRISSWKAKIEETETEEEETETKETETEEAETEKTETKKNRVPEELLQQSLEFYLYILMLSRIACRRKLDFKAESREEHEEKLSEYCTRLSRGAAHEWNIIDTNMIALLTDCFILAYYDYSSEKSFFEDEPQRYKITYPLRRDMRDIIQSYTEEEDYLYICKNKGRTGKAGETIFDFYSDYFLFFMMDVCTEKIMKGKMP